MVQPLPRHNRLTFFPALIAVFSLFVLAGCDDLDIPSGEFQYPIDLNVEGRQAVAELSWNQMTVSTFEEYVILRSIDKIPDLPEPEVTGNALIVARIDEREATLFKDSNLPITDTLYYKVYARIAGRFLMSKTIRYVQNLHLLAARADIVEPIPAQGTFVAFDRGTFQLYVYDYESREFLVSRNFSGSNFPTLNYSASDNEILMTENGWNQLLGYTNLNTKQSFNSQAVRSAEFENGWIYLLHAQFPYGVSLYRRSDAALKDEVNALQVDWRSIAVIPDATDLNKSTIYDFGSSGSARYLQDNTKLDVDLVTTDALGNAAVFATHPQKAEFVVSNIGIIKDSNLQTIKTLENGTTGFSLFTYSPDGSRLFGLSFQNNQVIRIYDAANGYAFVEEYIISNQTSPIRMFADENAIHLVSLVFFNGITQTLITTIEYE